MTVAAGEESHAGRDAAQVCLSKPGRRRSRDWFQESVPEPESVQDKDALQLIQIFCLSFFGDGMEATDIQGKVERTGNPAQFCGVVDTHSSRNSCLFYFSPGESDGARREIDAHSLPPGFGKRDDIGAGAAADINGATWFVCFDELKEFGGTDACIPGRLAEVPILKKQSSE